MDYLVFWRGGTGVLLDNVIPDVGGSCLGSKVEFRIQLQALNRNGGPFPCYSGGYPMPHQHGRNYISSSEVLRPICVNGNTGSGSVTASISDYYGDNQCSALDPPPVPISDYVIYGRDITNASPSTVWSEGYTKFTYPHPLREATGGGGSSVEGSKGSFNRIIRRGRR